jgi:hypothetical protein
VLQTMSALRNASIFLISLSLAVAGAGCAAQVAEEETSPSEAAPPATPATADGPIENKWFGFGGPDLDDIVHGFTGFPFFPGFTFGFPGGIGFGFPGFGFSGFGFPGFGFGCSPFVTTIGCGF